MHWIHIDLFRSHSLNRTLSTTPLQLRTWHRTKSMLTELRNSLHVRAHIGSASTFPQKIHGVQLVSTIAITFLVSSNFPNGIGNRVTQFLGASRFISVFFFSVTENTETNRSLINIRVMRRKIKIKILFG